MGFKLEKVVYVFTGAYMGLKLKFDRNFWINV